MQINWLALILLSLLGLVVLRLLWIPIRLGVQIVVSRRVLKTRRAWAILPTEEFDVTLHIIERVMEQVSSAHPWWKYWAYKSAAAFQIRLLKVNAKLLYVWDAPESLYSVIREVAAEYQVELVPLEEELNALQED